MTPLEAVASVPELVEAVSDQLWGMYNTGYEMAGVWSDSAMSDAERLVRLLGLDGTKFNAEEMKKLVEAQIPIECQKIARAAILALAENVTEGMHGEYVNARYWQGMSGAQSIAASIRSYHK